ncbi:MAG: PilZ domain-containing protein [Myxococcaceae bacterium]
MNNKRNMPRQRKRLRVEVSGSPVFTVDVSPGGFCYESMRILEPGSVIKGKIRVNDADLPFTGMVAWAKASEPRMQLRGRMGIRFTGVDSAFYSLFGSTR